MMNTTHETLSSITCRDHITRLLVQMQAKRVCEVGVKEGDNFHRLLAPSVELAVAVDIWRETGVVSQNDDKTSQADLDRQYSKMRARAWKDKRIVVARDYSVVAAARFANGYFDFVYLDADHSFESTYADLVAWWPKIRAGGVLGGHDFCEMVLASGVTFGVVSALQRFSGENNLLIHIDGEKPWPNWYISKSMPTPRAPVISTTGFWGGETAHLFHGMSLPLCQWIASFLSEDHDVPLYDFGCGIGQYMKHLRGMGFKRVVGFEGAPPRNCVSGEVVAKQDITERFDVALNGNVLCLEVMEHVPRELEVHVIENLYCACVPGGKLILSWALPGQGGHGHVNERKEADVVELLGSYGFALLEDETKAARGVITDKFSIKDGDLPWFRNTLFVFQKAA
jgi:hypothetical protein